jgi:hypothetical protein
MVRMKQYHELTIHEKLQLKQYAIDIRGKRWHAPKPNFLSCWNELQIWWVIGDNYNNEIDAMLEKDYGFKKNLS